MTNALAPTNTAVVPFSDVVPAYLADMESDLRSYTTGVGGGFPVLSIKGKVFTVVQDDKRTIVTRPDDPDAPASYVEVVFLRSNPALSKTYYAKGYEEGSAARPDCASSDGVRPDQGVSDPQSKSCAACPHNAFGSGTGGKGKGCQDTRRIAVAALTALDNPMLLRVPPASLKNLVKYATFLTQHNVKAMASVVTRIKFDAAEATPKLMFEPRAFLSKETLATVTEMAATELVGQIVGLVSLPRDEDPEMRLDLPVVTGTAEGATPKTPEPAAAPVEAPAPTPAPVEPPKQATRRPRSVPAAAPAEEPATGATRPKVNDVAALTSALDDLLGEYDG